jgi:23S rRNA U2552 (ribose-2'-O)-methylase RlmE/FtsJ
MPPKKSVAIKDKIEESSSESSVEIQSDTPSVTSINDIEGNKYKTIATILPKQNDKKENILSTNVEPDYITGLPYPKYSLGFHHYIHDTKDKMHVIEQFKGKKQVYRVTNPFEEQVDDYNDTINNACNKYFELGKKPKILSRGFYKLWEILMTFDLIPLDGNFISAHLAEGPGSFIQATMFYRELFAKNSKNDKYHAVTLHPEAELGHVPPLEEEFIKYYDKESPKRFILHKTYSKQVAGGFDDKDNGDILDPKTHVLFGGQIGEKVDFITADGGFNWKNENTQEQEAFKLILGQIIGAVKLQKKGGSFVCKLFETYTETSVKILQLLTAFYENVYVVKPLMSRPSNSEKYVVCCDFKFAPSDKLYIASIKQMDELLEKSFKTKKNIFNIFPEFKPSSELLATTTVLNNNIANQQFISINEIVKFIDSQNYYGDAYQLYREMQINASKYWIATYLPSKNKLNEVKKMLFDNINNNIKKNDAKIKELLDKVVYS